MEPFVLSAGSRHRPALTDLALTLASRSAGLRRSLLEGIVTALASLVRSVNCYYGFPAAIQQAAETLQPHRLAAYLYDTAGAFTTFFEACPVLRAPDAASRTSRLALCAAMAAVLACGLGLLGIDAPERM